MIHIAHMAKLHENRRGAKSGQYVSAGKASDGVVILRPAAKPTHFTHGQIEKTVDNVRSGGSGRFVEPAKSK